VGVDAAERGKLLRQRQDAVILRDEKQLAALLREVPPDLLRRDGLVVDGDAKLSGPPYDGVFREIVLVVVIGIQRQHLMLFHKIFKARQEHVAAEINDLHRFSLFVLRS
jgi:hypothetical protein